MIARATKSAIIIVRNLTKRYNDYAVIDDISFDMRRMLVDSVQEWRKLGLELDDMVKILRDL